MSVYSARLRPLRDGRFAVEVGLRPDVQARLLVTATSPRTTLLPSLIEDMQLPQIWTPTPIRGTARPLYRLDQGVLIGDFRLDEAVVAAHSAAGQFGVQGVLGLDWLAGFYRVCINQRALALEMHDDS